MTEKKVRSTDKGVKILDDAVKKYGGLPDVHKALIQNGVVISDTALYNAYNGTSQSLKPTVYVALAHMIYGGDGNKFLKALEADFLPPGIKKG